MNEETEKVVDKVMDRKINIKVNCEGMEKAKRLVGLLREAKQIADSLSGEKSEVNTEIDLLIVQMCRSIRERMVEKEENRKICSKMDLDEIGTLAALITARNGGVK